VSLYLAAVAFFKKKKKVLQSRVSKTSNFSTPKPLSAPEGLQNLETTRWNGHLLSSVQATAPSSNTEEVWLAGGAGRRHPKTRPSVWCQETWQIFFYPQCRVREINCSLVLPTSTLLVAKEAIPSGNGCPCSVFLFSYLLPVLVRNSWSLILQKHPRMWSCEKNSSRTRSHWVPLMEVVSEHHFWR